ncbi:hypothetical protein T492DRAFT_866382 [Pavlovales sp. CCMP2436]|nr:hypothetical protein T492DRAFT_866382 [Pavlovales sp. CCMP2436]
MEWVKHHDSYPHCKPHECSPVVAELQSHNAKAHIEWLKFIDSLVKICGGEVHVVNTSKDKAEKGPAVDAPGVCMHLHVLCADSVWAKAMAAGETPTLELANQPWDGGRFRDPFGQEWAVRAELPTPAPKPAEVGAAEHAKGKHEAADGEKTPAKKAKASNRLHCATRPVLRWFAPATASSF